MTFTLMGVRLAEDRGKIDGCDFNSIKRKE